MKAGYPDPAVLPHRVELGHENFHRILRGGDWHHEIQVMVVDELRPVIELSLIHI